MGGVKSKHVSSMVSTEMYHPLLGDVVSGLRNTFGASEEKQTFLDKKTGMPTEENDDTCSYKHLICCVPSNEIRADEANS